MNNFNIIYNKLINQGIYTQEELDTFINKYMALPVNTFAEWKKLGYKINKGEKMILKCYIWKPKSKKKQQELEQERIEQNEEEPNEIDYFKKLSYFFDYKQVVKI